MSESPLRSSSPNASALLWELAPYIALLLAVAFAYANIYGNAFVFDDNLLIEINDNLRDWHHIGAILSGSTISGAHIEGGFYRPVQMLLYLLIYQLGGGTTCAFHILNVTLHAANACLVYRLGCKLSFKPWGVFTAALIWAVHPLHTEAITYMSGTADPLFAFFCLLSLILMLPDFSLRKIVWVTPLFLLALLSKETAAMFPLLVMACLFYVSPRRLDVRTYLRTWPLWMIALAYSLWRLQAPGFDGPQTYSTLTTMPEYSSFKIYVTHPLYRFYTFMGTLPAYALLLIWPTGLHMERRFPFYTALDLTPVLTGIAITLFAAAHIICTSLKPAAAPSRGLAMSWGLLWFASAHAPNMGIFWPMNALFLEHWMYMPSIGLLLGSAETLSQLLKNAPRAVKIGTVTLSLLFAGGLSVKTFIQNEIWNDPLHFYANILAHNTYSARAHNNLALYFSAQHDEVDAIHEYESAIKVSDIYPETHFNLALTYLSLPDGNAHVPDAIDHLTRAVTIDPRFYRAWEALGQLYDQTGDKEKAADCHAKAASLAPPK